MDVTRGKVDVCVVTTIHPPYDARIYRRSVCAFAEAGLRVSIVCPWPEPPDPPTVRWSIVPAASTRLGRLMGGWRVFAKCMREPATVFQFHDLDFLPWGVLLRWLRRVRVVYDCHENYPEEIAYAKAYLPRWLRPFVSSTVRAFENAAVRSLGWVVVAAPSQAPRFEALGVNCLVSRNISGQEAMPDLAHQRGVVCIGTLSETYGTWFLADVARELKRRNTGVPMLLTDRFVDADLRADFLAICEAERLDVVVHPRVPPDELPSLLARASVGLSVEQDSPEKRLAIPSKLFDYMAMGLPVVASDLPNIREIVEPSGSGLLAPPGDVGAFVDAILVLTEDAELREACRLRGFKALKERFSWEAEAGKLVAFFRRALAANGRPSTPQ